jgi:hypothetical protein
MRCIIHSDRYQVAGNWNDIWKAQAPHKACQLLWQLCRGCIPTRFRLAHRHVDCDLSCLVFDTEVEEGIHVFNFLDV